MSTTNNAVRPGRQRWSSLIRRLPLCNISSIFDMANVSVLRFPTIDRGTQWSSPLTDHWPIGNRPERSTPAGNLLPLQRSVKGRRFSGECMRQVAVINSRLRKHSPTPMTEYLTGYVHAVQQWQAQAEAEPQ